jgi:DNA polymerase I-like protein with 3'-5' exonuclease and polymerase domains
MSKRLGHGSNYFGKPVHMAKQTHIELFLVQHFQSAYFAAFPELPQWHQWVITQLQTTSIITTFLGRKRRFFGRPTDEATWREAIAYEPQSVATGDYTDRALLDCVKEQYRLKQELGFFPYEMFLQKHDELCAAYLEPYEDLTLSTIKENMEQHITLTDPAGNTRDWYIPTDILTGWNLGYRTDSNPDGLAPASLPRTRTKLPNQFFDMRF